MAVRSPALDEIVVWFETAPHGLTFRRGRIIGRREETRLGMDGTVSSLCKIAVVRVDERGSEIEEWLAPESFQDRRSAVVAMAEGFLTLLPASRTKPEPTKAPPEPEPPSTHAVSEPEIP